MIGNTAGAQPPDRPRRIDAVKQSAAVTTRAQAKNSNKPPKSIKIDTELKWAITNRDEFQKAQLEDKSLDKLREANEEKYCGRGRSHVAQKKGLLYRYYEHPNVNNGKEVGQLVVPKVLRKKIMELAHETMMSGHMGIKKTTDRILSNFGLG